MVRKHTPRPPRTPHASTLCSPKTPSLGEPSANTIGWLMRHDLVQLNQSRGEAPPPSWFKSHKGSIMVMAKSR